MIISEISPEDPVLSIEEDLVSLPTYKQPSTILLNFSNLLSNPLKLHENLKTGCGGQIWPAGMVLAQHMLRYHNISLAEARILEIGAGCGLVGLALAIGCKINQPIYISDQHNMVDLMHHNIVLNDLESSVQEIVLEWGSPLPESIVKKRPNVILAADCVYFEPAFPLLINTLKDLVQLCDDTVVYFCFKKRRRADMRFLKTARKFFSVEEPEDEDRNIFSREGIFLFTFKLKE